MVDIVNHLAYGFDRVEDPAERLRFAELALLAGQTAYASLAFDAADRYLRAALSLLPGEAHRGHYDLWLGVHSALAETAMARFAMEEMDAWAEIILEHARDVLDKTSVYMLKLRADVIRTRYDGAVDLAVDLARQLGVRLPRKPTQAHLLWNVARTVAAVRADPLTYADLPETDEINPRAAIGILSSSAPAAYFAEPDLLPMIGMWCTRLSLRHGLTPQSPYGIAVWGLVLCGALGWIEKGYRFGQLALEIGKRYPGVEAGRAQFVFDVFIAHWKEPLREVTPRLHRDWGFSLENGDEETATYCAGVGLETAFFSGEPLDMIRERAEEPIRQVAECAQEHVKYSFLAWATLYENLVADELPGRLGGPLFDLDEKLPEFIETRNGVQIAISSIPAGILEYIAGGYAGALEHFERANEHADSIVRPGHHPRPRVLPGPGRRRGRPRRDGKPSASADPDRPPRASTTREVGRARPVQPGAPGPRPRGGPGLARGAGRGGPPRLPTSHRPGGGARDGDRRGDRVRAPLGALRGARPARPRTLLPGPGPGALRSMGSPGQGRGPGQRSPDRPGGPGAKPGSSGLGTRGTRDTRGRDPGHPTQPRERDRGRPGPRPAQPPQGGAGDLR